jgi:hypothetical protein
MCWLDTGSDQLLAWWFRWRCEAMKELSDEEEGIQSLAQQNTHYIKICHLKTKKEKRIVRNYNKN